MIAIWCKLLSCRKDEGGSLKRGGRERSLTGMSEGEEERSRGASVNSEHERQRNIIKKPVRE